MRPEATVASAVSLWLHTNSVAKKRSLHIDQCRLCLENRPLQDSHFVPKALYHRLRMHSGINPNPVVITRKTAYTTSRQVKDYLLCSECEQRFHTNGEDWVLRHYNRGNGQFPLRSLLEGTKPILQLPSVKLVPTAFISGLEMDQLAYFAVSVIWRAGVHRWRLDDHQLQQIEITPGHLELLRQFLVGKTTFPSDTFLWVSVADKCDEVTVFTPPYGGFDTDHYSFRFLIPGMQFALFLGPFVQPIVARFCSVRSVDRVIHLTPNINNAVWEVAQEFFKTCEPSSSLRKPT